ncbi:hypothetical protein BH24ACT22_BH24ACT22_06770 [soil metagenome]
MSTGNQTSIGPTQIGVAILALVTAGVHLYLFLIEGFLGTGEMLPIYQFLFVGNFFAYVTLTAALLLPIVPLTRVRSIVRTLLIAVAVASIASYFHVGVLDLLGNLDKAVEVLLIMLVTADAATSGSEEDISGRFASGAVGAAVQLVAGIVLGLAMFGVMTPIMV